MSPVLRCPSGVHPLEVLKSTGTALGLPLFFSGVHALLASIWWFGPSHHSYLAG